MTLPQTSMEMVSFLSRFRGRLPQNIIDSTNRALIRRILSQTKYVDLGIWKKTPIIPPPYRGEIDLGKTLTGFRYNAIPGKTPVIQALCKEQPHLCLCLDESLSISPQSKMFQYYVVGTLIQSYRNLTILGFSTHPRIIAYNETSVERVYRKLLQPPKPEYTNISAVLKWIYHHSFIKHALFISEGSHNIGLHPHKIVKKHIPIHIIDIHEDHQLQYISNHSKGYYFPIKQTQLSMFSHVPEILKKINAHLY